MFTLYSFLYFLLTIRRKKNKLARHKIKTFLFSFLTLTALSDIVTLLYCHLLDWSVPPQHRPSTVARKEPLPVEVWFTV